MAIVNDDGVHEDEFEATVNKLPDDIKRVYINTKNNYETGLTEEEEPKFQEWKKEYAPKDSGEDYDFRGAYKAGIQPDKETNHWPDTFKKPNHPTFSVESQYAKDAPDKAGSWDGETFYPAPYGLNPPPSWMDIKPAPRPEPKVMFKTKSGVEFTDHDIEDATNVAMSAGPATIAGVVSKTIDKGALAVAQAAEKEGIAAREITDKTGFFKGADNRWKYEIDDSTAKFNDKWADNPSPTQMQTGMKIAKLPEVIDHPELFEAYPKLKDYQVIYDNNFRGIAEFSGEAIRVGKASYDGITPAFKDKSILMHEVQHAVQDMEGFAKGGAPLKSSRGQYKLKYEDDVNKLRPALIDLLGKERRGELTSPAEEAKLDYLKVIFDKYVDYQKAGDKKAFEYYQALAGEVEARNVQSRVDLTPSERMKIHPIDTEDVARAEQLARNSATATTPYKAQDGFVSY